MIFSQIQDPLVGIMFQDHVLCPGDDVVKITAALLALGLGVVATPLSAQMLSYDLIPPYRVDMVVRAAGLMPVAPPSRYGASYIVRAIDRYGSPIRVVVDGRSGAIVAAHRIAAVYPRPVTGPLGPYGNPYWAAPGAYAPWPSRPYAVTPEATRAPDADPAVGSIAPPRRAALAKTPVPRARPAAAPSAEVAAVKPAVEPTLPADAPVAASPPPPEGAAPAPAEHVFPPVQPLE
jgi:hypothetical protein